MRDAFSALAAPAASGPSPERLAGFDLNDFGNAMRLILLAGGRIDDETGEVDTEQVRLLFLLGAGWVGYDDRRGFWDREVGEDLARRMAHRVAHKVRGLTPLLVERGVSGKDAVKFADHCGSAGATSAMLRQAQSYLMVKIEVFDRDPWVINCRNGTLRLRDAQGGFKPHLCDHDPADRITRRAAVAYDPDARAPLFEGVAAMSLPEPAEHAYFKRWLGYSSTGLIHEQAFGLTQGKGRDGKSTLLDAAREALGSYGAVGNVATFLDGIASATGPDPELVKLAGDVRLVILSEPKRGQQLNEGRLKQWTSGSPISARDLQAKPITFRPVGKLTFECNSLPVVRGSDDGIWRRVQTPIFRHQVPEDRVDKALPDKIRAGELAGVLNWLVAGVGDWMARGLDPPASLRDITEQYRRASSPFGEWLAERCVLGDAAKGAKTLSGELYRDFKEWFEAQGYEKPMSTRAFGDALRDKQVMLVGKNGAGLKYRGPIRLKTFEELAQDDVSGAGGVSDAAPVYGLGDEDLGDAFGVPGDGH